MTDYTDEEVVKRAQHAERLLADELLTEARDRCEQMFTDQWKLSTDEKVQYLAWAKVQALKEVWRVLEGIMREGEYIAEKQRLAEQKGGR